MSEDRRIPRQSLRYPVWLTATCRTSLGRKSDIILSDLSAEGCGINVAEGFLSPGQIVIIGLEALEGLPGQVVWVRGKRAGIRFDRALYGPVVEHLVKVQLTASPPSRKGTKPL